MKHFSQSVADRLLSLDWRVELALILPAAIAVRSVVPHYLPLVRQDRYLEMLLPGAVVVVGTMLHRLSLKRRLAASTTLFLMLGHSVNEAGRRSFEYVDSQRDMRELARYATSTVLSTQRPLAVDTPARNSLLFYLREKPIRLVSIAPNRSSELLDSYVAVGGARPSWWPWELIVNPAAEGLPRSWVLAYEIPGQKRPWRLSNLRVYYVAREAEPWPSALSAPQRGRSVPAREEPSASTELVPGGGECGPILIESRRIESRP